MHLFHYHAVHRAELARDLAKWPGLADALEARTLQLHPLGNDVLHAVDGRTSVPIGWYNYMLRTRAFWSMPVFTHPWLLLFEIDAVLCARPSTAPWQLLVGGSSQFGWPAVYVGAPWAAGRRVGNSGLSLWHRPTMVELADEIRAVGETQAYRLSMIDSLVVDFLNHPLVNASLQLRPLPTPFEAMHFSVETWYNQPTAAGAHASTGRILASPKSYWRNETLLPDFVPYGVHTPWKALYHSGSDAYASLLRHCPAAAGLTLLAFGMAEELKNETFTEQLLELFQGTL
tara:strand:- start:1132 stop:1992 length:861 start_codon:yes stop_codon:yes gene_type:complete